MMKSKGSIKLYWGLLTGLLILGVLALTLWGNSNNLNPRYLFIDEQITFYPIIKILNPSGIDEFLWLVSDGSDYRYGRILWNALALAALVPTKLFGESGQIIASREAGTAFLLLAYLLLTHTFMQRPAVRFAALLTFIVLPYNSYYMSMPKPEPIMLLCAAIFLYLYKKNDLSLGKPYWIFLGLAFGAKISFLLPLLALTGTAVLMHFDDKKIATSSVAILKSAFYIVLGFAIANPFFIPVFLAIGFALLLLWLISKLTGLPYVWVLALTFAIFISALLLPSFREYALGDLLDLSGSRHAFSEWTRATFLRINDGDAPNTENFRTWFRYLCQIILPSHPMIGFSYVIGIGIFLASQLQDFRKKNVSQNQSLMFILLLASIGGMLLLSPMLGVKNRLWGMYLFPGLIFVMLAFFLMIDTIEFNNPRSSNLKFKRSAAIFLLIATLALGFCSWGPKWINDFIGLGSRNSPELQTPPPSHLMGV